MSRQTTLNRWLTVAVGAAITATALTAGVSRADDADGFKTIFDGKNLDGWDGNPKFWRVEDGTITGQTTADNPTQGNTFIIWRHGELDDFELKLEYRIVGGNSGIQYRSFEVPNEKWVVGGYQADFEAGDTYSGILYGERYRGILANRGQKTVIGDDHKPKVTGSVGESAEIQKKIKKEDWNEYHIVAKGHHFVHKINGVVTAECTDEDKQMRRRTGILALQLHAGPPMLVQFRNIRLKRLPLEDRKKVVFVAGRQSHGYGAHEHKAGSMLLKKEIETHAPNLLPVLYTNGFPKDPTAFDNADTVVMYCDGGGGHVLMPHLDTFDAVMKRGVGLVCVHYGVEVPKGDGGDAFLKWIGGYFEPNWSVNPHWTGGFKQFADHPITRGVKPFSINDEWYYHMRFRTNMQGVTPILTDLPPKETLSRGDGPHSGNPDVRKAVLERMEPQHVAWAYQRGEDYGQGRGFGFTGAHVHWNWGNDSFRRLVLNAIAWTAKADVPEAGMPVSKLTVEDLMANQDEPTPDNFNAAEIHKKLQEWNGAGGETPRKTGAAAPDAAGEAKPLFASKLVTSQTPGHAVEIDVDITGAKQLYLVVRDGGNGFGCDWADWAEPRLIGPGGEKRLTELKWKSASTEWGEVRIGRNAGGGELRINGKNVSYGIGTHANSMIAYDLPEGYTRFKARAGLDNGGTDQGDGSATSVTFEVYTRKPASFGNAAAQGSPAGRDAAQALDGIDIGAGLEVTLFAAEPTLLSPTNIDIDHLGRVWVCEVTNYRHRQGTRPEGDRILVLEDTNGDGAADKSTVFYQGRDIDSAHGVCVLGEKVVVSVGDRIVVFTDADGDLKADGPPTPLFTGIDGTQHDHGVHVVMFGPDGKLYFNFGNSGNRIKDAQGKPITDMAGNVVAAHGKPYRQGMVFRCNLDGSEFETLGWNFRNNWQVTVDSFGTLWQSDNDDDGNRGVRINYVMEFGNYGYQDEITGAGWTSPRTNIEQDIPQRHWYQNDPGVVPNLLLTGAGSPTGIVVYEGNLLPEVFRNQVIHCDAGPNVVRAYPVKNDGAGYSATTVNLMEGTRDKWFRPSGVSVAPDGSLIVADWYDPGVGGHHMGDVERGRLFRVAVPSARYVIPKYDYSTPQGAVEALKNPNNAVRYIAWQSLHKMGGKAEQALKSLWQSDDARHRARALWLLGKIDGRGEYYVNTALADGDADLRATALRLARQLKLDLIPLIERHVGDASPAVRRECAIALRHNKSPDAARLWAELAARHDGKDRWQLEALGIGADKQWDAYFAAWLKKVDGKWNTPGGRDIVWRSRAGQTPAYLAQALNQLDVSAADAARYLRAFDFQPESDGKTQALIELAFNLSGDDEAKRAFVATEALGRLKNFDINRDPRHKASLNKLLAQLRGTARFAELVRQFGLKEHYPALIEVAAANPGNPAGIESVKALLAADARDVLAAGLRQSDEKAAVNVAAALGNANDRRAVEHLEAALLDEKLPANVRREAVGAMAKTREGSQTLIELTKSNRLPAQYRVAAGAELAAVRWNELRDEAAKLLPLPPVKNNQPLPPLADLVKRRGDADRGKTLFASAATCATCHKVNGTGIEFGPDLSEIGAKLSREAMYESILDPSGGISFGYEATLVKLNDGADLLGFIISETPADLTLRLPGGVTSRIDKTNLKSRERQPVSLMPLGLQQTMTADELVDLVEYLTTLKRAAGQ